MTVHIALLRAVNLGSHGKVSMPELQKFVVGLGFSHVRTLLNSGNLIFAGGAQTDSEIETLLERESAARLQLPTAYLVRTVEEWVDLIAGNPFPKEAHSDPSHVVVMFLKNPPDASAVEALRAAIRGPEIIRAGGRQLYISYPAGIGTSKLTNTVIENKLRTRGTGRNWNTVLKLQALAQNT